MPPGVGIGDIREGMKTIQRMQGLRDILQKPLNLTERGEPGFRICVPLPPTDTTLRHSYCCPGLPAEVKESFPHPKPGLPLVMEHNGTDWLLLQKPCPEIPEIPEVLVGAAGLMRSDLREGALAAAWRQGLEAVPTGSSNLASWESAVISLDQVLEEAPMYAQPVMNLVLGFQIEYLEQVSAVVSLLDGVDLDVIFASFIEDTNNLISNIDNTVSSLASTFQEDAGDFHLWVTTAFFAFLVLVSCFMLTATRKHRRENRPVGVIDAAYIMPVPFAIGFKELVMMPIHVLADLFTGWYCRRKGWRPMTGARKRLHPLIRIIYGEETPRARTGKEAMWARSAYYWVTIDLHSSRIRWPLLSGLFFGILLKRAQVDYNKLVQAFDVGTVMIFQQEVDISHLSAFSSALIYFTFLFLTMGVCIIAFFALVGNSTLHDHKWLGVNICGIIFVELVHRTVGWTELFFQVGHDFESAQQPTEADLLSNISTSFEICMLAVIIFAFLLLLWEQQNGVGGHLAEVNKQCSKYVLDRFRKNPPSHVKCKLCNKEVRDTNEERHRHWNTNHIVAGVVPDWSTTISQETNSSFSDDSIGDWKEMLCGRCCAKKVQDGSGDDEMQVDGEVGTRSMAARGKRSTRRTTRRTGRSVVTIAPETPQVGVRMGARVMVAMKRRARQAKQAVLNRMKKGGQIASGSFHNMIVQAQKMFRDEEEEMLTETKAADIRMPIFLSTLLIVSLVPPAMTMIPAGIVHIVTTHNTIDTADKLFATGTEDLECDGWTQLFAGMSDFQTDLLNRSCLELQPKNETEGSNIAAYHQDFFQPISKSGHPAAAALGRAVHMCGMLTGERSPAKVHACGWGLADIVTGLTSTNRTMRRQAVAQANWIFAVVDNITLPLPDAPPEDMPEAIAVFEGYMVNRTQNMWRAAKEMVGILTNSNIIVFKSGIAAVQNTLAIGHIDNSSTPLALDYWMRFHEDQLQHLLLVCTLGSGDLEKAVPILMKIVLPSMPSAQVKVVEDMVKQTLEENRDTQVNATEWVAMQRSAIRQRCLPLARLAVVVANFATLAYAASLLLVIRTSYRRKLRSLMRQKPPRGELLPEKISYHQSFFEATLFPGYVLSTLYLSGQVVYGLTLIPFIIVGMLMVPGLAGTVTASWQEVILPLFAVLFMKKIVLNMIIFERMLHDQSKEIRNLRLYGVVFPAIVMCNFIIGQYYGLFRLVVAAIFSFIRCSRVDQLAIPQKVQQWMPLDAGYDSFMCVVGMAAREYNPTKRVMLKLIAGDHVHASWYLREKDQHSEEVRPAPAWSDSRAQALMAAEATTQTNQAYYKPKTSRGKIRWHLALMLLRNPMLQRYRKRRLEAESEEAQRRDVHWMERINLMGGDLIRGAQGGIEMAEPENLHGWPLLRHAFRRGRLQEQAAPTLQDAAP